MPNWVCNHLTIKGENAVDVMRSVLQMCMQVRITIYNCCLITQSLETTRFS